MALKPTIYKLRISLSDLNRDYYDTLNLTLAQHPSETEERMMVRVLAYCLNAQAGLNFTKGLSAVDEPDIWAHSLDGNLELWVDVGEPAPERIKKARGVARQVSVYCFNSKATMWWQLNRPDFERLQVKVMQLDWGQVQHLASLLQRTMELSITISDDSAYVATALGEAEISFTTLQDS
ncbi:MAG: hypothetical protein COC19_05425 [SAR86 cluster bacterium]|uniref:YaeQ family protein n=1 Tax=SAR86 cluster bacterium TaxID=2030880 RepID=A0A2A4MLL6_9GAMM|nr:MAG: hypothetical protein COC19_05425 [SAR86 cluster bacterium]